MHVPCEVTACLIPAMDAVGIRTWMLEIARGDRAMVLSPAQALAILDMMDRRDEAVNHLAGIAYAHKPRGSDD